MDTTSLSGDPSPNNDNETGNGSAIVSDDLNHYASEFFLVNNWIEKYSPLTRTNPFIDEAVPVDHFSCEEPGSEHFSGQVSECVSGPGAGAVNASVESVNFWTAPIMYKKGSAAKPAVDVRNACEALLKCTVINCSCDHCAVGSADSGVAHSMFSYRALAPVGWCALVFVCVISAITQLVGLSNDNCELAQGLCNSGKYQESLDLSSLSIRCNPFNSRAYFEKGRALVHMLRYHEAEECLNRCLAFNADDAAALDARAALALKMDNAEQAIKDSLKLMTLLGRDQHGKGLPGKGLNIYQYGNLAVAYYKSGSYDLAIKYYDKALALDSDNLSLSLGRTYCLSGKEQHKQALAACDSLIKRHGVQSQLLALRGYCRESLHDLAGAQKDFDLALAEEPNNATFYGYRAALLSQLNKPAAALADSIKAADLNRYSAQAQHVVARMLKDQGRNQEALRYYDRLAQCPSFEKSFDQHQERAALNFDAGNYQASLVDLKRAIELEPDCDLRVKEALCLAHLGQPAQARAIIAEAYQLRPSSPSVMLGEAHVEAILGQTMSAVDKYSKVLAAGDNREALVGRAQCYFGRKQWASAAEDYRKAVLLGVSDASVKGNLAQCQSVLANGAKITLDLPVRKIVDLTKFDLGGLSENGRKAYQDGDMQLATVYFSELTKRDPASLEARKSLAHSLEGAGNHQEAIAVFEHLSVRGLLEVNDQYCYAHALAAVALYERSIAIMQRLHDAAPASMTYRLELAKMFSASGQIDKAIGICRDSLAMGGSSEELKNLNNVYESLVTEKQRSKKDSEGGARGNNNSAVETQG